MYNVRLNAEGRKIVGRVNGWVKLIQGNLHNVEESRRVVGGGFQGLEN